MYKLIGFIMLVFAALGGTSQTNTVFPDSNAYWREAGIGGDIGGGEIRFTDYLIKGDTVIDSVNYKNLYENKFGYIRSKGYPSRLNPFSYYASYGLTKKIAVVRRDSLKVFLKIIQPATVFSELLKDSSALSKEYLVFDFGWQPGDTIFSEFYTPGSRYYLVIKDSFKDIKPVTGNSDSISYLTFVDKTSGGGLVANFTDSNTFISGMGFTSSFFLRFSYFDTNYVYNRHGHGAGGISEFCSDGKLFYKNPVIYGLTDSANLDCGVINTQVFVGVDELKRATAINVYPNPVKDILTLSGIEGTTVKIKVVSVLGRVFPVDVSFNGADMVLDVSALPPGFYSIIAETDGKLYPGKFMKE